MYSGPHIKQDGLVLALDGSSGQYFFEGLMAVAKIYNTGLSAQEVQQNYNAYKNRFNI